MLLCASLPPDLLETLKFRASKGSAKTAAAIEMLRALNRSGKCGQPLSADTWLEQRSHELDWRLKKFTRNLKGDALEGVRFRDGRLQISPVRTIATPDADELAMR